MKALHPNLARIAAEYDEIVLEAKLGQITPAQASTKISKLVAKDDQGLDWVINPLTGNWQYKNSRGEFVDAQPPEYGFASPTPKDIGSTSKKEFDSRLNFHEVNEDHLNKNSVLGATRREIARVKGRNYRSLTFLALLLVVIALIVIFN
jgi:hypothetical protein